jgi:hypothetical protein
MSLARYDKQRDKNEQPIVKALRQIGAVVVQLDRPCDLLVGYRGFNFLLEVKLPLGPRGGSAHSELNESQKEFDATWPGQFDVVRTPEEAIETVTQSEVASLHLTLH